MGVTIIKNIEEILANTCTTLENAVQLMAYMVIFFSPRSETAGSYLCQQQAFSVHLHLH